MREPAEWPEHVDRDLIDQDDRALTKATRHPPTPEDREADIAARRYETWLESLKDYGP